MDFSVIIPVYNAKDYLDICLHSVFQQSANYEILLVDDGSTDGESGTLCDRYAAEHPDCVRVLHKENGGAGDARNAAIPLARGEYLLFLDSDDALEANALEELTAEIERTHADVYYYGMRIVNGNKQSVVYPTGFPFGPSLSVDQTPELLLTLPAAWNAIWKRSLFEASDIRFRKRGWGEDLVMTRKMLTIATSVIFLQKILYCYVLHSGSVTARENLDCNYEIVEAIQDVLDWYQQQDLFDRYCNELCKLCVDNVLYDASVRILKVVPEHPLLEVFRSYTIAHFPDYRANPYLHTYPARKKLVLMLLGKQQYRAIHLLFRTANRF